MQIFDREINDVQTIHESVESGSRVSAQAIRSATGAAEKLLRIVDEAVSRIRTPEVIS